MAGGQGLGTGEEEDEEEAEGRRQTQPRACGETSDLPRCTEGRARRLTLPTATLASPGAAMMPPAAWDTQPLPPRAPPHTIAPAPRGRREGRRILRRDLNPTDARYGHCETVEKSRPRGGGAGSGMGPGSSGAAREAATPAPLGGGSGTGLPAALGGGRGRPLERMWVALIGRATRGALRAVAP